VLIFCVTIALMAAAALDRDEHARGDGAARGLVPFRHRGADGHQHQPIISFTFVLGSIRLRLCGSFVAVKYPKVDPLMG
jgi:hypothetical protein